MKKPEAGIAIIGYGVMGRAHAYAYRAAPVLWSLPCHPRLRVLSGRNRAAVASAAAAYGFERWTANWRAAVHDRDVDIVDVCTPPGTHPEIVEEAAKAGKAVICEKPLAVSLTMARRAVDAVRAAGVLNAIGFNYRRLPALSLMRQMIGDGAIGDVRTWRTIWQTDEFADPAIPYDWRFDRTMGGTTIADLGVHLIDLALWMVGPIAEVAAHSATFVPQRWNHETDAMAEVTVADASGALFRFASGTTGILEVSRAAVRRPCDMIVEANGSRGTLVFDYARLNELWYGSSEDEPRLYGLRRIRAEHQTHPYAGHGWPIGQGVGYGSSFVNQVGELLEHWPNGPWVPDLADALMAQAVCSAMEEASEAHRWVEVPETYRNRELVGTPA